MNSSNPSLNPTPGTSNHPTVITRVADGEWQALEDDRLVGRGETWHRVDGRLFLSIDSWQGAVFERLAEAMLAELPKPLYTMVDQADTELTSQWQRAGFTARRREWQCLVPTDPRITGLDPAARPRADVTVLPAGEAEENLLYELDRAIRDEVEAAVGWHSVPAEVLPRAEDGTAMDPSRFAVPAKHAVAVRSGEYVGLVRVTGAPRLPRIGLVAVRADHQRRGIARTLLTHALDALHRSGVTTASAEINEDNEAATALFAGIGAQRASSNLELELR
jgi:ribosomal protein S18 acetylase RimI-like enzyme